MAFIGMRHPVVARMSAHTDGQEPTYTGGMVIGHAISGNLSITRNNNPLYGDDVIVEDDNGITAMSLDMGVDDVPEDVQVYCMGLKERKSGDVTEYADTDRSAPNVGIGYIRIRRKDDNTSYQGIWMYKCVISQESEESKTKGQSIEWGTPTLKARAAAIDVDGSGDRDFRKKANFKTEGEAIAWLNKLADIKAGATSIKADGGQVKAADAIKTK